MWLPMGQGLVCQLATRWASHLLKGNFKFKICPKLPPKCNFNCYLHQGFHWLGPDTVIGRWWMRSSTVLTMSWFQAVDTSRFTHSQTQKCEFLGRDEGTLPPATPVNPYLWGSAWKKWSNFKSQAPLQFAQNCISGLKTTLGGLLRPQGCQGDHHVGQTWYVSKGLTLTEWWYTIR